MAQITSGVYSILSNSLIYDLSQRIFGADNARHTLVHDFFPNMSGLRLLDVGCGTAEILKYIPNDVAYFGFDPSETYIRKAKLRFGHRGSFFYADYVQHASLADLPPFDLVLAAGVLHHLDDGEAAALFKLAKEALHPSGRLLTIDPTYTDDQSLLARRIISKVRGQNVRRPENYIEIAHRHFSNITHTIRHDLMNIPFSHLIMDCS